VRDKRVKCWKYFKPGKVAYPLEEVDAAAIAI